MRDFERWKDRVEISLDGRQIFFLFFGSAVAACLIFVGGVFIGKRIDARAATPLSADDPLAALDQLDSEEPDDGLTFHEALVRDEHRRAHDPLKEKSEKSSRPPKSDPTTAESDAKPRVDSLKPAHAVADKPSHADSNSAHADAAKPAHVDELVRHASAPPVPTVLSKPLSKPDQPLAKKIDNAEKSDADDKPDAPKKSDSATADAAPRKAPTVAANPAHAVSASSRYTLQLSSFADQSDADAFAQKIRGAGYKPSVVRSEVPGKGTFFRVRVGDFQSKQAADQAKDDYEHKQHAMVYVAPL